METVKWRKIWTMNREQMETYILKRRKNRSMEGSKQ